MIKNYFKIAIRQLAKYKVYSLVNIGGLTVGLTTCFLIFLWMTDEISADKFHVQADHIYKVMINDVYPDGTMDTHGAATVKIGDALRKDVPGIEQVVQTSWNTDILLKYNGKSFTESGLYADASLFSIFSFHIITGNASNPLPGPSAISISENLAKKFFNSDNPIGKTIELNRLYTLTVASVFKNIPQNSSLQFDYVISFELWKKENTWAQHWRSGATQAFVLLNPASDFRATDAKVRNIIKNNCPDCAREAFLYPFSKLYLHDKFENGKSIGGRINQLSLFAVIAAIILIMACINFTNLATARATTRSREIGIRKAIGASKNSIGFQFIGESVLLSFIAMGFSIVLVSLLIPLINGITGKSLFLDFSSPLLVTGIITITLLCGLLAGLYPSFYLASLNVTAVFKNKTQAELKGIGLRKALVIMQFTASLILITGSVFVYKQLLYIFNKDLGFNKEHVIVLNQREGLAKNFEPFKSDLLQIPAVKNVAFVGSNLFQVPITTTDPVWPNKPPNSSLSFKILRCDEGFIPAMHIDLKLGRNFSNDSKADSSNYIINETAMQAMGLNKDNVIGTKLEMWNGKGQIIGLTDNFLNGNLHQSTKPLILMFSTTNGSNHLIKITENANESRTLTSIAAIVKKYAPDYPFEYRFLDDMYKDEYKIESIQARLFSGFTMVSVLICCLGLFGLSTFAAERKIKEIGIRKVLGAGIPDILRLISKDFLLLIFISILVAVPVSWYLVSKWMQGFAFHTALSWWVFAAASILVIIIAMLTIGFQTIKTAMANPVKSLRTE